MSVLRDVISQAIIQANLFLTRLACGVHIAENFGGSGEGVDSPSELSYQSNFIPNVSELSTQTLRKYSTVQTGLLVHKKISSNSSAASYNGVSYIKLRNMNSLNSDTKSVRIHGHMNFKPLNL
jgi:hypothetical protein